MRDNKAHAAPSQTIARTNDVRHEYNHLAEVAVGLSTAITAARFPGLACRNSWHKLYEIPATAHLGTLAIVQYLALTLICC
jgi:hypothetical protein